MPKSGETRNSLNFLKLEVCDGKVPQHWLVSDALLKKTQCLLSHWTGGDLSPGLDERGLYNVDKIFL